MWPVPGIQQVPSLVLAKMTGISAESTMAAIQQTFINRQYSKTHKTSCTKQISAFKEFRI